MVPPPEGAAPNASRPNNLVGAFVLILWLTSGAALAAGRLQGVLVFAFVMLGWILAVMAHEFSHAAVAYAAGDHTIRSKGYLSFDPRRYGDLGTSLVIPLIALALGGIGFPGGAVYLRNDLMRSPAWRSAASLAGPVATLIVLMVLASALNLSSAFVLATASLYEAMAFLAFLQATALILNLLPVPGLDGFNAIKPFLPKSWTPALRRAEGFSLIGLLVVIFFVPTAGRALFMTASALVNIFGIPSSAWIGGYEAFRFWG